MGAKIGGTDEYNSEINVTPMVDVMLVLLIIFMIVTPDSASPVIMARLIGAAPRQRGRSEA